MDRAAPNPHDNGADLTYVQLHAAGGGPHEPEAFDHTTVVPVQAFRGNYHELEIVPDPEFDPAEPIPPPSLMRAENPIEAYAVDRDRDPIRLDHHRHNWGEVLFAFRYPCIWPGRFRCPANAQDRRNQVAIKKLRKEVVHRELQRNNAGTDNPYKEVARMRELTNENFVLKCIDFLEDDDYLYIVTPRGERTLKDHIWAPRPQRRRNITLEEVLEEAREEAVKIFHHLLKIVNYLLSHRINHHDLSPGNVLIMPDERIVVFDFAKSLRMPINPDVGHRHLMHHLEAFGTRAWMSPEVFGGSPYDGCAMDVWAASVIFYNMVTAEAFKLHRRPQERVDRFLLYREPSELDLKFQFFLDRENLTNEHAMGAPIQFHGPLGLIHDMVIMANVHMRLDPNIRRLLAATLKVNVDQRLTLRQLLEDDLFEGLD